MSRNIEELKAFIERSMTIGESAVIATSQYANSPSAAGSGYHWNYYSTPQAIRSLANAGLIEAEYGWRFYKITRLR